jgi:hypothetical protein
MKSRPFIELRFGPKWKYISTVRTFIQNFLAITLENQIKADKISMAVSELVENAVKYSNQEDTFIRLEQKLDGTAIEVAVYNHTEESQANKLKEFMVELEKFPALEGYMEMMRRSANAPEGKSQLGLARIRYEAEAQLNIAYENNVMKVRAAFKL